MEKVVPWAALLAAIELHYPTTGRRGRPPMPLSTTLWIYFMQQWYALSDPAMEDALYEIESMRRFAGLDLTDDAMLDETTIPKFHHLLEKHGLTGQRWTSSTTRSNSVACCSRAAPWSTPRNRSLSGVLFPPAPTRKNPSHADEGGICCDQGDIEQQQVAAA